MLPLGRHVEARGDMAESEEVCRLLWGGEAPGQQVTSPLSLVYVTT